MHAPELSRLYFAGIKERKREKRVDSNDGKGRRVHQAILLDATGWEREQ